MDMTGSRRIEAPRERVWEALNDPAVLEAAIPGCESVERTGDDSFQARVSVRIGPMSAKFTGKVTLSNVRPPEGYTISGEGQGGAMGFARGGADVALAEEAPGVTLLTYDVKAQVGGKMAQLGARLVDSTAKQMADQFFDRFAANLAPPPVEPAQDIMANPNTSNTAVEGAPTVVMGRREAVAMADATAGAPREMRADTSAGRFSNLLNTVPREPLGMPIVFWIGSGAMVGILALLFAFG
ncbi:CoxG family protein [Roseomonas sp. CCTCC AB2023176]|uniref:CoxG family protein n=1 Tax=Roseomonas sp. CCTCC AB2023176 TaxID=3342640 RepID=UPI0035D95A03